LTLSDQDILAAWNAKEMAPVGHLDHMKSCQIDVQFISPRPFQMMHSEKPAKIVHNWTAVTNDLIHRSCELMPGKFYGIGGLPQMPVVRGEATLEDLTRGVKTRGFRGVVLTPDPGENRGVKAPPLGDPYWSPLYEKLQERDVVAPLHARGSREREREPYT